MRPTALAFVLVLSGSSAAFAGAPGDYYGDGSDDGGGAPGQVEPVGPSSVAPTPCSMRSMGQRWSIGFGLGQTSLAPKDNPDGQTDYAVGQLALTYRATHHLELALELGGGREQLQDGTEGDRELSSATLGLRYRFNPGADWNWWVMGGLGRTTIASAEASQQERDALAQKHALLGIGIERRFARFALQAEMRWISIGKDKKDQGMTTLDGGGAPPPPTPDPTTTDPKNPPPTTTTTTTTYTPSSPKLEGGQFTIGLAYYF